MLDVKRQIKAGDPSFEGNERLYVLDCLRRGWITQGVYVERFEREFAAYIGARHAIACSSGTAALHLALLALGIGPGDEVIVPTLTFVATANAVVYTGADPVFVDVDPQTWTISKESILAASTRRTKAILPVHLYGVPADVSMCLEMTVNPYGRIYLIEDAAEALGAAPVARDFSDAACFSFYGNKTITTGEGGMIVTNRDDTAAKLRLYRGQGQSGRRYWHEVLGYNYRMTDIQAAIGCAQLERLPGLLEQRAQIADAYDFWLERTLRAHVQRVNPGDTHGNWAVAVKLPGRVDRDQIMLHMAAKGIETRPVFYPLHTMPMYATGQSLPIAEDIARRGIVLPTHANMTDDDVRYVCEVLNGECV